MDTTIKCPTSKTDDDTTYRKVILVTVRKMIIYCIWSATLNHQPWHQDRSGVDLSGVHLNTLFYNLRLHLNQRILHVHTLRRFNSLTSTHPSHVTLICCAPRPSERTSGASENRKNKEEPSENAKDHRAGSYAATSTPEASEDMNGVAAQPVIRCPLNLIKTCPRESERSERER